MNDRPTVFIVDDDGQARRALTAHVQSMHLPAKAYCSAEEYLEGFRPSRRGCLLVAAEMSGMGGLELLGRLGREGIRPPAIFVSADGDLPTVVAAMKAGAVDFLKKPCRRRQLREAVEEALRCDAENRKRWRRTARIRRRVDQLTAGERDVLAMLVEGNSNTAIARTLGLSVRAIEVRRAKVMRKMKAGSLAELVRLAMVAENGAG